MTWPTDLKGTAPGKSSALLVEPGYPSKVPPLSLLKISTIMKGLGYRVDYAKGKWTGGGPYDEIMVTTLFTHHWADCVDDILFYQESAPKANISVGGAYATLMPEHLHKYTGIWPQTGVNREIDEAPPDYSLLPSGAFCGTSHVFTSRGCPRNCPFCGTRRLEPEMRVIENWKRHFLPGCKNAFVHDNNVLAHGDQHFEDVLSFFRQERMHFMFDNGFDCRLFERRHAEALSHSMTKEIRFSFDGGHEDGHVQTAIGHCLKAGVPASKIKVFVLYNFKDDLADALYRVTEVHRLGAKPWAMRYTPLTWLNPDRKFVSKSWGISDLQDFNHYVNRFGIMKRMPYQEWVEKRQRRRRASAEVRPRDRVKEVIRDGLRRAKSCSDEESLFLDEGLLESLIRGAPEHAAPGQRDKGE